MSAGFGSWAAEFGPKRDDDKKRWIPWATGAAPRDEFRVRTSVCRECWQERAKSGACGC
jgi:hypothetical protein